ncbi:MAG: hypothetical protein H0T79_11005, partial [Deltaproteobacteria bacterium]|nr:hypothetical protein [Deltaproteobacteria bacterium]
AKGMEVRYTTKIRPFIAATVSIAPCFDCIPMDLEKWKAKEPALKALWPKELWTQPGSIFEPGVYDFAGQPMISIYQLGQVSKLDENENPDATYGHAYILHYNDGINSIRVVAEYRDMPMRGVEALGRVIPRESFEKLAQSFMDAFTHAW